MPGSPRPSRSAKLGLEPLEGRDNPVTVAVADLYSVNTGSVLTVPVTQGVLANDFNTLNPGGVLTSAVFQTPTYVGSARPLPAGSLILNPNGSFTFIAPTNDLIPDGVTAVVFTYTATSTSNGEQANGTVTINLRGAQGRFIAVAPEAGGGGQVRVFDAGTNVLQTTITPYEAAYTGGVRVALGDVNGDGTDDIATVPQLGGSVRLRVFNGLDGNPLVDRFVFDPAFRGGGYVAMGDINGDGRAEIIVGAGEGGGPRVTVFAYTPGSPGIPPSPGSPGLPATPGTPFSTTTLADFFAYTPEVRSGVRVAAGDLSNSGRASLVTSPGVGGGPQVNVFAPNRVRGTGFVAPTFSFFAGSSDNRDGVYVTVANLSGTGAGDIVVGAGAGAAVISVYDGRTGGLTRQIPVAPTETVTGGGSPSFGTPNGVNTGLNTGILLNPSLTPGSLVPGGGAIGAGAGGTNTGGVRVAATDFDGDGLDEILAASGPGQSPRVRVISAKTETEIISIFPFPAAFLGGVNVAGSSPRA